MTNIYHNAMGVASSAYHDGIRVASSAYHESVMVNEVVRELHIKNQAKYIDATLGTGGHTEAILKANGQVLAIEADSEMLKIAENRLKSYIESGNCKLVNGNFTDIDRIAQENGFNEVSGILFDLGVSNLHLTDSTRGFSFGTSDTELDMRLNRESQGVKASDLLNALRLDQLVDLFKVTMEPGPSRWLSSRILAVREDKPIKTVSDFLEICRGLKTGKVALNEATLPFLALRIAVNSELDNLRNTLPKAYKLLEKNGYLVVITFHSREEDIVKEFFDKKGEYVAPTELEVNTNPRSRSAKMRILQRT
ncbi:MAG TPA: 16S rRNA (cytosine(1402)-N(4))-methyltransferase RsmH [Patescibacteria group bacterium]|nr:16S rRNA (cytosine(1402)-N(4))-methyltransferase RsmH [Patescibacteria group bacterium]